MRVMITMTKYLSFKSEEDLFLKNLKLDVYNYFPCLQKYPSTHF